MAELVRHIHKALLAVTILIVTLVLALNLSILVQDANARWSRLLDPEALWPVAIIAPVWALLSMPLLRLDFIVAPHRPVHLIGQVTFGLLAVPFVTLSAVIAASAPVLQQTPTYDFNSTLPLSAGALVLLTVLLGCLRAFLPVKAQAVGVAVPDGFVPALQRVHHLARRLSALGALVLSGAILVSILILDNPRTQMTALHAMILFSVAVLLLWPRFALPALKQPQLRWHAIPHVALVALVLYVIERTTRAFLYHTPFYATPAAKDAAYPMFENIFMLPFIVFALVGVALALPRRKTVQDMPSAQQVFG